MKMHHISFFRKSILDDSEGETVEFTNIASESSALASFARKAAAD